MRIESLLVRMICIFYFRLFILNAYKLNILKCTRVWKSSISGPAKSHRCNEKVIRFPYNKCIVIHVVFDDVSSKVENESVVLPGKSKRGMTLHSSWASNQSWLFNEERSTNGFCKHVSISMSSPNWLGHDIPTCMNESSKMTMFLCSWLSQNSDLVDHLELKGKSVASIPPTRINPN